ncbi:ABC transporter ATP-binding protein [Clostridium tertium]|jgi:ABC-2 type transport system ATP-binding protein|uniref:ABC transporter ATP-binding protein n=1 Tax=Clostridium TaxID=1485 RepID=UPI0018AA9AF1|nr:MULTISPECIES: ABC transporter ATP-binding protein [Clostridium]MBS5307889.1 ABC transporter ATP-binding protein [Clostridium sp.]MDB1921289.1 ABC transporter ATP-binding protein [Clostridium tertium]MDB1924534.1 ABC transporter ATP-binding protein [Clostridium tertium]MDB1928064.1 ABC transporter ATP-binding protein [Clostridium tertium]MDB1945377.1 ABC transporter ATP-binding protein [Clostridium tertium]
MLVIKNLEKSYGNFKALNGLNLEIEKGEIFGFIGPNGAGKSTTMKIVSGLLSPDSGEVYVDGIDAIKNNKELKDKIGYMPDFFGVYDNLRAIEYLEFYASIYGIVGEEARKLSMDLLELVNLQDKWDANVDGLSRGMKQRLCLARCLVHNPELLILDEPASGMDPRARFEMKGILKNLKEMGKTIIVSSHILSELGEICTRIGIIKNGSIVCEGTVEEVMLRASGTAPINITVMEDPEKAIEVLKQIPDVKEISLDGNKVTASVAGGDKEAKEILKALVTQEVSVIGFAKAVGNLEDVFIQITEDDN